MGLSALAEIETVVEGAPEGRHLAPRDIAEVEMVMRSAYESGTPVRVWGGGTRQRMGSLPPPGWVMTTSGLSGIETWEPDDLTVVVGAGTRVRDLEARLGEEAQTAVLPERPGDATLGGVLATARSPLRRARLLSPRERVLEVTMVTGDGRVVRSGGRVVKNVSGFDLHRAAVGSFGSLGVIVQVCMKLWPVPAASATVRIPDLATASRVNRPLAVLETGEGIDLFLWGTEDDIASTVSALGCPSRRGLDWPDDPEGAYRWSLRVPPATMPDAIAEAGEWRYLAIHGSGEIRLGSDDARRGESLREWAERHGGSLVLVDHPGDEPPLDPWGRPPPAYALQARLIAQFDPARIINRNRLAGGL